MVSSSPPIVAEPVLTISLPLACPSLCFLLGTCGTCACKVSDPEGVELDAEFLVEKKQREEGFILSCVSLIRKDGLTVDLNEEEAYMAAR